MQGYEEGTTWHFSALKGWYRAETDLGIDEKGLGNADEQMEAAGWTKWGRTLNDLYDGYEVWRHHRRPEYLVEICRGDEFESVLCDDLPSALELMRMVEAITHNQELRERLDYFEMVVAKFFEAWHGHQVLDSCRECDRFVWRQQRRAEAEAAATIRALAERKAKAAEN